VASSEETNIFLFEAYENLDQVEQDLLLLEKDNSNKELLNRVFRAIHTIKSNSGFFAYHKLEKLCHAGENILDDLRAGRLMLNADLTTLLLSMVDAVRAHLQTIETTELDTFEGSNHVLENLRKIRN
jgi:two-component system chemotaxis sensor kinase CheA